MYLGKRKQPTKDDYVLYFFAAKGESTPKSFNQAKVVVTPFSLEGKAPDNTNGYKMIKECVRLLEAYSATLSGGWIDLMSGFEDDLDKIEEINITGQKTQWVAAGTW
jgi:hypothetical protein